MALADLGRLAGDLRDALQLTRSRADADDGCDGVTESGRVEVGLVAPDHSGALEPLHTLGDRRRREPDATSELGHSESPAGLKLAENS